LKERLAKLEGMVETLHTKDGSKKAVDQGAEFVPPSSDHSDAQSMPRELGRLVIQEGESRYIENSFWVALSNEVRLCSFSYTEVDTIMR
jgi:hypothetical protein